MRMLVGLGNPGPRFAGTRHNLGFDVLDAFARQQELVWKEVPKWKSSASTRGPLLLLKPQTFMNLSGEAVQSAAHYYRIHPAQILVIHDDLALSVGRLRLRKSGSDGGHNGLASILQLLGTRDVPRLRIGIGAASHNPKSYVLEKPPPGEAEVLQRAVQIAMETIHEILDKGLDAAMNKVNTVQLS
jgi:PTH1 family peptidyl-tRNA hydrolase